MWPQFEDLDNEQRRPLAFTELISGMQNAPDLRHNQVPVKFWLPEPAEQALGEMAERSKLTISEFLRQFLTIHCYGLYAFHVMRDANPKLFKDSDAGVFYQAAQIPAGKKRVTTYWVPELGKNIAPVKVWMPMRLQVDLSKLAQHASLTLSNYVREIVISRLFGQGMLPTRPEMFNVAATSAAEDWNEGRQVPLRQIPEEDCPNYSVVATRDELVDE